MICIKPYHYAPCVLLCGELIIEVKWCIYVSWIWLIIGSSIDLPPIFVSKNYNVKQYWRIVKLTLKNECMKQY